MDAKEYIAAFDEVKADFEKSVAEFGLPFEAKETQFRETRVCVAERLPLRKRECELVAKLDFACVRCMPHRRANGDVLHLAQVLEALLFLLQPQPGRLRVLAFA